MTGRKITQTRISGSGHRKKRPNREFGLLPHHGQLSDPPGQNPVDQAVVFCFGSRHEIVPFRISGDLLDVFTSVFSQDSIQPLAQVKNFTRMNFNVGRLTVDGS